MRVEAIGVVTLIVGAIGFLRGPGFSVVAFVLLTLLGSAGAVLLGGSGTIQPAHLMLGFLALACVGRLDWSAARQALLFPQAGFWLAAFTAVALGGAVLLPRLLEHATFINAIGTTDYGPSVVVVPLGPTSGNVTQSIYIAGNLLCFLLCVAFASRPEGFRLLARAAAAYCVANMGFALLDLATFWSNTGWLFDPIRNADYALHTETVTTGLKRIVGSFTEAAAFSYATLGAFGFAAVLWLAGLRAWLFGPMALASLLLLVLSTSSTAYLGAPLMLALVYALALLRATRAPCSSAVHLFLATVPLVAVLLICGIMVNPKANAAVTDVLSAMVFDKASSQSGLERGQWNAMAWQNLIDTNGIGAGLGSVRASSFPLAVLANTGVPGLLLLGLFLALVFRGGQDRDTPSVAAVRQASRVACVGLLVGATISGAMVDLGLAFFVFAALACARPGRPLGEATTIAKTAEAPHVRRYGPSGSIVVTG